MSFWGAIGGGIAGALFGQSSGSRKREMRRANRYTTQQMQLGNQMDLANQKDMFNYRMDYGRNRGLTDYELFMGPAAGAGGGTSGSGQTLGNAASQQAVSQAQLKQQNDNQIRQLGIQAATGLQQTKMQTDAQKEVAKIQAGVSERGQDIQKEVADNVLSLNTRELNDVKIPQAAAQLNLSRQQLKTEINKTATSSEKFQKEMKQLSMGPANLLVELTMRDKGISLADDSFMKLSEEQRQEILTELLAMASTLYVEASGFDTVTEKVKGKTDKAANSIADLIAQLIVNATGGSGIEATNAPPNVPKLGARFSQPGASGPNMNYR